MQPPQDEILRYFAAYIEKELGIVYADHNFFQLQTRLEEIARGVGVPDLPALKLKAMAGIGGEFRRLLLDVATNNETSFFRDPRVFQALEAELLAPITALVRPGEKLGVWSAACSSGQEVMSTAIMLSEWNEKHPPGTDFRITATDISERILTKAKAARYSSLEVQRGLSPALTNKYFDRGADDTYTAKASLLRHTTFQPQNLKETFDFSHPFHLVLCRNVLIYQNVDGKNAILKKIAEAMVPGAFLVLGSGESLIGLSTPLEQVAAGGVFFYRKKP